MRVRRRIMLAVPALFSVCLVISCSRTKPSSPQPAPSWHLQPITKNAVYENKFWHIDTKVFINNQRADRGDAGKLAHRLRGTYESILPNGGGESNVIAGFWQRDAGADLTIQICAGRKERFPAGTELKVTIRDTKSDQKQLLVLGLEP